MVEQQSESVARTDVGECVCDGARVWAKAASALSDERFATRPRAARIMGPQRW